MGRLVATGLRRDVGDRTLWADLRVDLGPGEVLVVRGPSGCGKTLLLRALAGLDPVDGTLTLGGVGPERMGWASWRRRLCYVAQETPTVGGSPAELLAAVRALRAQAETSRSVDPAALAEEWGLGRDTWEQPWSELSGGERQRAALAIAVSTEPNVLLLDEPTSALDPDATAAVEASLRGRSMVWVTHSQEQAERLGGRVLELAP